MSCGGFLLTTTTHIALDGCGNNINMHTHSKGIRVTYVLVYTYTKVSLLVHCYLPSLITCTNVHVVDHIKAPYNIIEWIMWFRMLISFLILEFLTIKRKHITHTLL